MRALLLALLMALGLALAACGSDKSDAETSGPAVPWVDPDGDPPTSAR